MLEKEIEKKIIDSIANKTLFETINDVYHDTDVDDLIEFLANCHNHKIININQYYQDNANSESKSDMYYVIQVYGKVIQETSASVENIIDCISELIKFHEPETYDLVIALSKYCSRDEDKCLSAFDYIIKKKLSVNTIVSNILIELSRINYDLSLSKALQISSSDREYLKQESCRYIDCIKPNEESVGKLLSCLSRLEKEEHSVNMRTSILEAALSLSKNDIDINFQILTILRKILADKETEYFTCVSRALSFNRENLNTQIEDILVAFLIEVPSDEGHVINIFGYYLEELLKKSEYKSLESVLTTLLQKNDPIRMTSLSGLSMKIVKGNKNFLGDIIVKWFLSGEHQLCNAIYDILQSVENKDLELDVSHLKLNSSETTFVARKMIGWLFMRPTPCVSLILSMLEGCSPKNRDELKGFLLDPLLISYPGELGKYLDKMVESSSKIINETVIELKIEIEAYFSCSDTIEDMNELHISQEDLAKYWKNFNSRLEQAKEDGPKSIVSELFTQQHLLYGNSSAYYVTDGDGNKHRNQMKMTPISVSFEMPRLHSIDPGGLDFMLRVFRSERFINETNS